jgi:hypothetical protein
MRDRPNVGARVRILGNTGLSNVAGKCGSVIGHHEDGISFVVELEVDREQLVCDPVNVQLAGRSAGVER